MGKGGAIIAWRDERNSYNAVIAQAISSTGTVKWMTDGVAICTAASWQEQYQLISDGQGGAIIAWSDCRDHINIKYSVYAQAISKTGTLKWSESGIAICTVAKYQGYPQLVSDGQGGAIIIWLNGDTNALYTQSVSSTGTFRWTANGVIIVSERSNAPQIVTDGQGGAIMAWFDRRDFNTNVYAQSINSTGITRWTPGGIAICTTKYNNTLRNQQLIPDGQGGAIVTFQDQRNGGNFNGDIYAQAVNSTGILQWTLNGVALCTATCDQLYPQIASDGQGGAIITWQDYRSTTDNVSQGSDVYVQRISINKNVQDVTATPGDKWVVLNWTNPVQVDYSATKIMRRSDHFPTGPLDGTLVYWFNGTVCLDTGLINGQTYYYGIFAHDTSYNYATGYFKSVYLTGGDFSSAADTTAWGFQKAGGVSQMPSFSWLSSYNGRTGILKLSYSGSTEGVKLTSMARSFNGAGNNWYRIRVQYSSDSPNSGHEIISQLLSYVSPESYAITEVGGNWTGNGQMIGNKWYTYDAYVYSKESSQQPQLILKNNGSTGDFYIDSIQCDSTIPPAVTSPVSVPMTIGDYDTAADSTSWGFQNTADGINGKGTLSWASSIGAQNGVLALTFNNIYQGAKITASPTYSIATNRNAMMSFKFRSNLSNPTTLHVLGYLYGEKDLATFKVDLAGKAVLGNFPGNQWNTAYIPLTSVSQNSSFRMQLIIKNNTQSAETVYIDDVQLVYSSTIVATQQWVQTQAASPLKYAHLFE